MKITKTIDNSSTLGVTDAKEFSIDTSNQMIVSILRDKLYANKIAAVCREVASNARDANREAGRGEIPVVIEILRNNPLLDEEGCTISFQDSGIGISPERIENVFLKYGSSTKRDSNTQTGGFGIGAKTPFAYNNEFLIETVSESGGKRIKNLYQAIILNEGGVETSKLISVFEEETLENTGTKIIVPIEKSDIYNFEKECFKATMFWEYRPEFKGFEGVCPEFSRVLSKDEWSVVNGRYKNVLGIAQRALFIIVDGIFYNFYYEKASDKFKDFNNGFIRSGGSGYSYEDNYTNPILEFKTGEITLSASREEIEYIDSNLELILERFKKMEEGIISEAQKMFDEKTTTLEKIFFLNAIKYSGNNSVIHNYFKAINVFDKIVTNGKIDVTYNNFFRTRIGGRVECNLIQTTALNFRISNKGTTNNDVSSSPIREGELKNSLVVYLKNDEKLIAGKNATLRKLEKDIVFVRREELIIVDSDSSEEIKIDKSNRINDLLKEVGIDFINYEDVEKTKVQRNVSSGERKVYVKKDKNIGTIYVRTLARGSGGWIKDSLKYNKDTKTFTHSNTDCNYQLEKVIVLNLSDATYELKDLDKMRVQSNILSHLSIDFANKNYRYCFEFLRALTKLNYTVIVLKKNEIELISGEKVSTVTDAIEEIIKRDDVLKDIKSIVHREQIEGTDLVNPNEGDFNTYYNNEVGRKFLSLVGFNLKDYKIFTSAIKKDLVDNPGEGGAFFKIKANYSYSEFCKYIIDKVRDKFKLKDFEGYLTNTIVESKEEEILKKFPVIHYLFMLRKGHNWNYSSYDLKNQNGTTLKEGISVLSEGAEQLIDLELSKIKSLTKKENVIAGVVKVERRGRPAGAKNKPKA